MSLRQTDHSPLAVPSPSSSTAITAAALESLELFVLARRKTDHHIGLARSQRQNINPRPRTHGAESLREGGGRVPPSLHPLAMLCTEL